jgi:short-subunit dehydrogenase
MAGMSTALITGATAGLGRGYAEALAQEGHDLVLVARNRTRLDGTAAELRQRFGIGVEVMAADLATTAGRRRVERRLQSEVPGKQVEILVNNAGFSANQPFVAGDLRAEQAQVDVMITAPMQFCHTVLPAMVRRGSGLILNVSSIAGWATEGTYSAAKSWLTTFTEGLQPELAGTGVHVTAVCPGAVRTEFFERSGIAMQLPGFMWLDVEEVVAKSLRDVRRGRVISVTGPQYEVLSTATQYVPRPLVRFITARRRMFTG